MKLKKFIGKLYSYNYDLQLFKEQDIIYEGDIKEFIEIYSTCDVMLEKIKGFYFCRIKGVDRIVIHLKENEQ